MRPVESRWFQALARNDVASIVTRDFLCCFAEAMPGPALGRKEVERETIWERSVRA